MLGIAAQKSISGVVSAAARFNAVLDQVRALQAAWRLSGSDLKKGRGSRLHALLEVGGVRPARVRVARGMGFEHLDYD